MKNFDTLSEAMTALQRDGYTEDFNQKTDCIECRNGSIKLTPEQFRIDQFYRFEGMNDPGDEMILYAISSYDDKLKGLLVNAYGVYEDSMTDEMTKKLSFKSQ